MGEVPLFPADVTLRPRHAMSTPLTGVSGVFSIFDRLLIVTTPTRFLPLQLSAGKMCVTNVRISLFLSYWGTVPRNLSPPKN